ncbi:MAG: ester cyclase [Actinomycetota bacterium]|nr:ester cyclase [Actinomycetota bacterium]
METTRNPIEVATSYLESFTKRDPDLIASHVSEDFKNIHTSALGDPCEGRSSYRNKLPGFLEKFKNLTYECEEMIALDEKVFVSYLMKAEVDGNNISINGVFNLKIVNGYIESRIDYFDSLTFLKQIGHPIGLEEN